ENDHRKLEKILVRMEELELSDETNDEYIQLNLSFHQTLRSGCPWPRVLKMVENLGISPIAPSLLIDYYQETQREHRLIYESVLRGDTKELKAIVEYHIFRTKNNLIQHMDRLQTTRSTSVEQKNRLTQGHGVTHVLFCDYWRWNCRTIDGSCIV